MTIGLLIGCIDRGAAQALHQGLELEAPGVFACQTADLAQVVPALMAFPPDVLLLENPADGSAGRLLSLIHAASPATRALLLYETCTHELIIESIRQGASGCLLKTGDAALCAKAIRAVHNGETWYGRMALLQALRSQIFSAPERRDLDDARLTRREEEILHLIGTGLTNKEIGRALAISDKTVKTHLHRVYVKLHQSGRYKAFLTQPGAHGASGWITSAK